MAAAALADAPPADATPAPASARARPQARHSHDRRCHAPAASTSAAPAASTPPPPNPCCTRSQTAPAPKPQVNGPRTPLSPRTPVCTAGTRARDGMVHPSSCRVPQHQPIQQPYNNHTTTIQQPYNNHTTTIIHPTIIQQPFKTIQNPHKTPQMTKGPQDPKGGAGATPRHSCATARRGRPVAYPKGRPHPRRTPKAAPVLPLATLRYGAARAAGGLPEGPPPPPGPQRRRRGHPSPPCATARRGRPEAYPKGRPHPLQVTPRPLR
jgi:hypothetical protein